MADLSISRDDELMVAHVEGETDTGVEFVDGYMPADVPDLVVVDVGRIIVPVGHLDAVYKAARQSNVTWEVLV